MKIEIKGLRIKKSEEAEFPFLLDARNAAGSLTLKASEGNHIDAVILSAIYRVISGIEKCDHFDAFRKKALNDFCDEHGVNIDVKKGG